MGRGRAVPGGAWESPGGCGCSLGGEESTHAGVKQLFREPVCTGEGGKTGRSGLESRNLGPAAPDLRRSTEQVLGRDIMMSRKRGDLGVDVSQLCL